MVSSSTLSSSGFTCRRAGVGLFGALPTALSSVTESPLRQRRLSEAARMFRRIPRTLDVKLPLVVLVAALDESAIKSVPESDGDDDVGASVDSVASVDRFGADTLTRSCERASSEVDRRRPVLNVALIRRRNEPEDLGEDASEASAVRIFELVAPLPNESPKSEGDVGAVISRERGRGSMTARRASLRLKGEKARGSSTIALDAFRTRARSPRACVSLDAASSLTSSLCDEH